MQNQSRNNKTKTPLIFKPYLKGNLFDAAAVKRGIRLMAYYLMFVFLYLIVGSALQFDSFLIRTLLNLVIVLICAMIVYMDGSRLGENEVAFGEIALARQEAGKPVDGKDKQRCFHPGKGWIIALIAVVPVILITLPHAFTATKQVYSLQSLPRWVSGFSSQEEISAPLAYYNQNVNVTVLDVLRMVSRILIFPFANIATANNPELLLTIDRLSPLLASLPLLGFPIGYLTGPRSRAMIHGGISSNNKRVQRKKKKAIKARQARTEKKNEII
ncbi:MAG: hypothetical protein IK099_14485 [Clostridia bacterium]|nr:hypothetical protein [Clostridia bacterium]